MFGYPSHDCYKPIKPYKPISFDDQWSVDQYNMEVENYNSQLQIYISCIEDFVDNANNDIKRIREKAEEAINEANY
ncbi:MAG TPA: hypothetical protein EYO74_05710 [Piscirickettsiaceae bacterium]|jgi:hypothetical protein|nr:hypothetical protein [Piscirickettsiaceae bacterium]